MTTAWQSGIILAAFVVMALTFIVMAFLLADNRNLNAEIDDLYGDIDRLNARVDRLVEKTGGIKFRADEIEDRIDKLKGEIGLHWKTVTDQGERLEKIESEIDRYGTPVPPKVIDWMSQRYAHFYPETASK
jgi:uncharacterized coiled-coil DUF342 family protein